MKTITKSTIALTLLLVFSIVARGQEKEGRLYKENHENGVLWRTGTLLEGNKFDGKWKYYYKTGKIHMIKYWKNGVMSGKYIYFDKNGDVELSGYYLKGKKTGEWIEHLEANYRLHEQKTNYKNGVKHGAFIHFLEGEVYESGNYIDGKKNGIWTKFIVGSGSHKQTYLNGELNGINIYYDENGTVIEKTITDISEKIEITPSTMTDSRDGQVYKTVKIGSQVWMAENLNYKTPESYAYDDNENNREKYGLLYTWEAANKACPVDWHIPSYLEWQVLIDLYGGDKIAGKKLISTLNWKDYGNGTDNIGFNALIVGSRDVFGEFVSLGNYGSFWSSSTALNSLSGESQAWKRSFNKWGDEFIPTDYFSKQGIACRCLKD